MYRHLFFNQRVQSEVGRVADIGKIAADVAELKLRCSGEGGRVEVLAVVLNLRPAGQRTRNSGGHRTERSDVEGIGVVRGRHGHREAAGIRVNPGNGPVAQDHGGSSVPELLLSDTEWQLVASAQVHRVRRVQIR